MLLAEESYSTELEAYISQEFCSAAGKFDGWKHHFYTHTFSDNLRYFFWPSSAMKHYSLLPALNQIIEPRKKKIKSLTLLWWWYCFHYFAFLSVKTFSLLTLDSSSDIGLNEIEPCICFPETDRCHHLPFLNSLKSAELGTHEFLPAPAQWLTCFYWKQVLCSAKICQSPSFYQVHLHPNSTERLCLRAKWSEQVKPTLPLSLRACAPLTARSLLVLPQQEQQPHRQCKLSQKMKIDK